MPKKVAVVGGGISGLAAAASLVDQGFDVHLLEASDYFGGRLKQVDIFPGFPPIDLGGDFIHGSTNIIHQLAKENEWKVKKAHRCQGDEAPKASCIFIDGKLYTEDEKDHPDVFAAKKAFDDIFLLIAEYLSNSKGNDNKEVSTGQVRDEDQISGISLHTWLQQKGFNQKTIEIADSHCCQSHGGTLDSMGLLETGLNDVLWESGTGNFRLEGSYSVLISYFLQKCGKVDKRLNWPVKKINWIKQLDDNSSQMVCLTGQNGQQLQVDYVVITVPLTILKAKDILFTPPLPINKQHAINSIYMGPALKIVCRFKKPFWGETLAISCPGCFIHQVWTYSRDPKPDGEECHVVVGFETAVAASQKVHLSDEIVCKRFVQQLDDIYGTETEPKPATANLMSFVYYHWSKHPYVRGGYSSPTVNTHGMRQHLAESIDGKLFFAGEATGINEFANVQAALQTGLRAAKEVCKASGIGDINPIP